jgi:hypothetical protein
MNLIQPWSHCFYQHDFNIAGKTFTMFGPGMEVPDVQDVLAAAPQKETHGIVIRACEEVFRAVEDRRRRYLIEAEVHVSYVEVRG